VELKVTHYQVATDGVATLVLDRPGRGNCWTGRMHDEMRWICARLDADPAVRVIVVTGAGTTFCAGAGSDGDLVWQLGLRKPMIAAVNGACAGIAVALVAFCDLRIGVKGAKITTASPKVGLPAACGLSWILPRLVGMTHSADILSTGRVILAEEMGDWGFFNAVVPAEAFDAKVADYAQLLAAVAPESVTTAKRQLWGDVLMRRQDHLEGVGAMREKRPPRFVGQHTSAADVRPSRGGPTATGAS
jgi:enoyl-CoA hydratase/carnithine racemase